MQDSTAVVNETETSVESPVVYTRRIIVLDSATIARNKFVKDSITWNFLRPDVNRKNLFVEELLEKYIIKNPTYLNIIDGPKKISKYGLGKYIDKFPFWIIVVILVLLLAFSVLRLVFQKNMKLILQAFYDDRALSQINKEDNVFSSWFFLFSYLLYSLFIGMFLYLLFQKLGLIFKIEGILLFLIISLAFALFLGVKILSLRFFGFFFQAQRVVRDYINSIYLSFFNISLLFIPLTICFSLILDNNNNWILLVGLIIILLASVAQVIRVFVNILSTYKLSKFYLFLYLCALEICPVLIIIKALNI